MHLSYALVGGAVARVLEARPSFDPEAMLAEMRARRALDPGDDGVLPFGNVLGLSLLESLQVAIRLHDRYTESHDASDPAAMEALAVLEDGVRGHLSRPDAVALAAGGGQDADRAPDEAAAQVEPIVSRAGRMVLADLGAVTGGATLPAGFTELVLGARERGPLWIDAFIMYLAWHLRSKRQVGERFLSGEWGALAECGLTRELLMERLVEHAKTAARAVDERLRADPDSPVAAQAAADGGGGSGDAVGKASPAQALARHVAERCRIPLALARVLAGDDLIAAPHPADLAGQLSERGQSAYALLEDLAAIDEPFAAAAWTAVAEGRLEAAKSILAAPTLEPPPGKALRQVEQERALDLALMRCRLAELRRSQTALLQHMRHALTLTSALPREARAAPRRSVAGSLYRLAVQQRWPAGFAAAETILRALEEDGDSDESGPNDGPELSAEPAMLAAVVLARAKLAGDVAGVEKARTDLTRAIARPEVAGDPVRLAVAHLTLADVLTAVPAAQVPRQAAPAIKSIRAGLAALKDCRASEPLPPIVLPRTLIEQRAEAANAAQAEEMVELLTQALELVREDEAPVQRAALHLDLARMQLRLGQASSDGLATEAAAKAAAAAADALGRLGLARAGAEAELVAGQALQLLAERRGEGPIAQQAAAAVRRALALIRRAEHPDTWGRAQFVLGRALFQEARASRSSAGPDEAAAAFRQCLRVRSRETNAKAWAATQNALGEALYILGRRGSKVRPINEAIEAFDAALQVHTRSHDPIAWAIAVHYRGLALVAIGERLGDLEPLTDGIAALEAAATELTREKRPGFNASIIAALERAQTLRRTLEGAGSRSAAG